MSLASDYAAAVAALSPPPTPFTGPGGILTANVDGNGNAILTIPGRTFTVPPALLTAFATWVTATFT